MKKQILYPDFHSKIFSTTMDLIILAFLASIIDPLVRRPVCMWSLGQIISANGLDANNDQALIEFFKTFSPQTTNQVQAMLLCQLSPTVIQLLLLATYSLFFNFKFGKTPAKFVMRTKIVDQETLQPASKTQLIKRMFASITYPIGIWFAIFSKRKQALHDMFAGTLVIKN